jgi:hypothetical protein
MSPFYTLRPTRGVSSLPLRPAPASQYNPHVPGADRAPSYFDPRRTDASRSSRESGTRCPEVVASGGRVPISGMFEEAARGGPARWRLTRSPNSAGAGTGPARPSCSHSCRCGATPAPPASSPRSSSTSGRRPGSRTTSSTPIAPRQLLPRRGPLGNRAEPARRPGRAGRDQRPVPAFVHRRAARLGRPILNRRRRRPRLAGGRRLTLGTNVPRHEKAPPAEGALSTSTSDRWVVNSPTGYPRAGR